MHWSLPGFLAFTVSQSLLTLMSIELVMPSNLLFVCPPLLLLPSIFPNIGVFSSESALHISIGNKLVYPFILLKIGLLVCVYKTGVMFCVFL